MKLKISAIVVAMAAVMLSSLPSLASAQLTTECNPLTRTCPADRALSKSANFDFTGGAGPDWEREKGVVKYGSGGAEFTIAKQGDNNVLRSTFYIMFGRVEFVVKAAPGTGIVSTVLLSSDCRDEIDFEWLGGDNSQVQTNYYRQGQENGYKNGAFHANPGNHDAFKTYAIDWNMDRILWQVDGATVRTLTADEAGSQYPQTPARVKVGIWAAGDPTNPPGTIEWSGGRTNFGDAPFTMQVKSIRATDYSSGSEYLYSDRSGSWQSIKAVGGQVNRQSSGTEIFSAGNDDITTSTTSSGTTTTSHGQSATKAAPACPDNTSTADGTDYPRTDDGSGDCSGTYTATPTRTWAPTIPPARPTGAASKMYTPIGTQALVVGTSFWVFLGTMAFLF